MLASLLLGALPMVAVAAMAPATESARPQAPAANAAAVKIDVTGVEAIFLDFMDAVGALGVIDSGLMASFRGRDRDSWQSVVRDKRAALTRGLSSLESAQLADADEAVLAAIRKSLESVGEEGVTVDGKETPCGDAQRRDLAFDTLRAALVGCFREIGNALAFEDREVDRGSALQLLHEIEEPARRKALFNAFVPLWSALNGRNEVDSPYRRMIAMAAAHARERGSEVDAAARALGVSTADIERWLVQILEEWRRSSGPEMVEPWDFRYVIGEANRLLAPRIPATALVPVNQRYYADLGADLGGLGVLYDLAPRADKSPLAYTDFLSRGRRVDGEWRPTVARVVGTYPFGGLFSLNELVHENGHAVHISAIRNRPAYTDWPDTLFVEAFADVPSWSVYEPAWQRQYLGAEVPEAVSLRALFGSVMLDVAWSLFEIRMLRDPASDPNAVWTDITSHYLRIVPHPELSWWAMRVQLVSDPGYMVNYGLGAVLTAEIRRRLAEAIGPYDAGNRDWYPWLSEQLLVFGSERDTRTLMHSLLGRPVSPDALISQIRRLRPIYGASQGASSRPGTTAR
jgi:hypothetical protein